MESSASFLFHRPKFVFRNPEKSPIVFEGHSAHIYFSRLGDTLLSLDGAPFGSFILADRSTTHDVIALVEKIVSWSTKNGIANLLIRSFPEAYHPQHSRLIKTSLHESGFTTKYEDTTQAIPIQSGAMRLDTHKKRRLRKAEVSGFSFRELSLNFLEEGYSLIVDSRENKGYPVTMSMKDLADMFALFPSEYLLFGVFDKHKLISVSVSIKVNTEILYCFYIGDDLAYRSLSPVTYLINGIYQYCRSNHFRLLDLGISTDKGILNKGLYTFKKTFGSVDSPKLTFVKQL